MNQSNQPTKIELLEVYTKERTALFDVAGRRVLAIFHESGKMEYERDWDELTELEKDNLYEVIMSQEEKWSELFPVLP
jgi:hypothetical protein